VAFEKDCEQISAAVDSAQTQARIYGACERLDKKQRFNPRVFNRSKILRGRAVELRIYTAVVQRAYKRRKRQRERALADFRVQLLAIQASVIGII
jgi:hypothetical protein